MGIFRVLDCYSSAMPSRHAEPVPRSLSEGGNLRKPQEGANANGSIEQAFARADGGAAAGVKILAIVGDEVSARGQIQKLLNEGYQPLTGEPITMDNIKFYQLPDNWTQADIEREALDSV